MNDITAIILTKNEEKNISRCILSIQNLVKRILVIDSGSTDNTVEISKKLGAEVVFHEFVLYAKQFNWALDNCNINTKWVMRIDADESLTKELCNEITDTISKTEDTITGFIFRYRVIFLGKWIKYGGSYPVRKLGLFRNGIGRIEDKEMDEHTVLSSGGVKEFKNDVIHYDFKSLSHWIDKHNWYASREMNDYFKNMTSSKIEGENSQQIITKRSKKSLYYKTPMFIRAHLLFIYRYYFCFGFLDGKEGLIYHFLQAYWYRFLVDAKIHENKSKSI